LGQHFVISTRTRHTAHSEITDVPELAAASMETAELNNESQPVDQEQGLSDWGQNLVELQERLETRMHSLRSFRKIEDSQPDSGEAKEMKASHITAWARDLEALQHQMEKRAADIAKAKVDRHELMEKHAVERKDRAEKRRHDLNNNTAQHQAMGSVAITENVEVDTETEKPLMQRILDLGRELCSEPERRDRPSCIQFLNHESSGPEIAGMVRQARLRRRRAHRLSFRQCTTILRTQGTSSSIP